MGSLYVGGPSGSRSARGLTGGGFTCLVLGDGLAAVAEFFGEFDHLGGTVLAGGGKCFECATRT